MSEFIPWDSQPLTSWAKQYAAGKQIELDGHLTHYLEQGKGDPVILVHGFYYDSHMWSTNIQALADKYKVYALDLWGFGYSTREPMDYSYALYVKQLQLFMDALQISKAVIVGQSMGGGAAITFALKHPERVSKLVLVDAAGITNPLPLTGKFFNLTGVGEFLFALNTNLIRKKLLTKFWIHNKSLVTNAYFKEITRFHKIIGTTKSMLTILRNQFFDTLNDEIVALNQLNLPILIIWGKEDTAVPLACGEKMHTLLKNSEFTVLNNAGHVPNFDRSDEFNRCVLKFIAKISET